MEFDPNMQFQVFRILCWTAAFFVIQFASGFVSRMSDGYNKLPKKLQVGWDSRVVALLHALIVSPYAAFLLIEHWQFRDDIHGIYPSIMPLYCIAIGYFLWDLADCLRQYQSFGPAFLFHAIACLSVYSICLFTHFLQVYGAAFLLFELSTPFINLAWLMDKHGVTSPWVQYPLGISTLTVFFVVRIVIGSWCFIEVWPHFLDFGNDVNHISRAFMMVTSISLWVLNLYWFKVMIGFLLGHSKKNRKNKKQE